MSSARQIDGRFVQVMPIMNKIFNELVFTTNHNILDFRKPQSNTDSTHGFLRRIFLLWKEHNYSATKLKYSPRLCRSKGAACTCAWPRSGFCIKRGRPSLPRLVGAAWFSQNLGKRISIHEPHKKRREKGTMDWGEEGRGEKGHTGGLGYMWFVRSWECVKYSIILFMVA